MSRQHSKYDGRIPGGRILDLWASGLDAPTIAERLGQSAGTVHHVITKARRNGDPRAAPHDKSSDAVQKTSLELGYGRGRHAGTTAAYKNYRRRQRLAGVFSGVEEMLELVRNSDVVPTKLPTGWHMGHRPKCLDT